MVLQNKHKEKRSKTYQKGKKNNQKGTEAESVAKERKAVQFEREQQRLKDIYGDKYIDRKKLRETPAKFQKRKLESNSFRFEADVGVGESGDEKKYTNTVRKVDFNDVTGGKTQQHLTTTTTFPITLTDSLPSRVLKEISPVLAHPLVSISSTEMDPLLQFPLHDLLGISTSLLSDDLVSSLTREASKVESKITIANKESYAHQQSTTTLHNSHSTSPKSNIASSCVGVKLSDSETDGSCIITVNSTEDRKEEEEKEVEEEEEDDMIHHGLHTFSSPHSVLPITSTSISGALPQSGKRRFAHDTVMSDITSRKHAKTNLMDRYDSNVSCSSTTLSPKKPSNAKLCSSPNNRRFKKMQIPRNKGTVIAWELKQTEE
eukprot:m.209799 g.209799  ORF g.209799 m.209799 type:complete len:375 (+) comp13775_c3_seq1:72-1196(+)